MSALFNFDSFLRFTALFICTATYIKKYLPQKMRMPSKGGSGGIESAFYTAIVIGERLSIYISLVCLYFGIKQGISVFY